MPQWSDNPHIQKPVDQTAKHKGCNLRIKSYQDDDGDRMYSYTVSRGGFEAHGTHFQKSVAEERAEAIADLVHSWSPHR